MKERERENGFRSFLYPPIEVAKFIVCLNDLIGKCKCVSKNAGLIPNSYFLFEFTIC